MPPVLRPLRDRALALLWCGLAASAVGDELFSVAISWVAVQVLGTGAGYLRALQALVILGVALLAGRWADRRPHRRVMILADLGRAATLAVLVLAWLAAGSPPAWCLVGGVVAVAAGQALFRPALQATLPQTVRAAADLPAANALLDSTDRIARLLGPGLVSVLTVVLPLVHFVTVDVVSFLASAGAIGAVVRLRPSEPHAAPGPETILDSMRRGFRALLAHRVLGTSLLLAPVISGAWNVFMFFGIPLLITQSGRAGSVGLADYGLVVMAYGSTNLLTALIVGGRQIPLRPAGWVFGADILFSVGIGTMGLAGLVLTPAWLIVGLCAAAALTAINGPFGDIPIAVLAQTRLHPRNQAAAMRALLVSRNLGALAGLLAAPALFNAWGVAPVFVASAAVMTVLSAVAGWRCRDALS